MRVMLILSITAGLLLCFGGSVSFKEARTIQKKVEKIQERTEQFNKEREALAHFKETTGVDLETVCARWMKDMVLLATMRKVSLGVEMKNAGAVVPSTSWPGVQKRRILLAFSGLQRWRDSIGLLAGIDASTRITESLPIVLEEVRQERNVLFVEVELFGTATKEEI